MRLKSLQMQGFKSFPDKIELTFDRGLTAVVGPNGSGKSNISDAVRWVLGEQSSKNLRGNKMEDVIFAGTKSRSASGFAVVTLTIENLDRSLNVDEDEVSVTRKLYRSGESEYLLNGRSVRLRDVTELFMDTGLGKDGYSIIGQGRIAEIVSAKGSERREIFEEASGISKFRYKKSEAEKKLSLAEENMVRLNDIVSGLQERIEPLREQSEKAKQYVGLAERRKSVEVSVWLFKVNDLRYSLEGLRERIKVAEKQYETLETQVEECELEVQQGYHKMQESSAKAENLQNEVLRLQQMRAEATSNVAVYRNDITHAKLRTKELNLSKDTNTNMTLELSQKVESLTQTITEGENVLEGLVAQVNGIDEQVKSMDSRLHALNTTLLETSKDVTITSESIHAQNLRLTTIDTTIRETQNRLATMHSDVKEVEDLIVAYTSEAEEVKAQLAHVEDTRLELSNKLNGFERLLSTKREKLETLRNEYQATSLSVRDSLQRVRLLRDLEASMEGFSKSVKLVLKAVDRGQLSGVFGTVAQLLTTQRDYSLAIETALGGATQNVVVQSEETAKRCIKHLKDVNGGRATFLPLTAIEGKTLNVNGVQNEFGYVGIASELVTCESKFEAIKSNLLGRIVIVEDIDCATVVSKKYGYRFKVVTLDGQVINAGGSYTGGSAVHTSGVFSRKAELETLETDLHTLQQREKSLKSQGEVLSSEVEGVKTQIEALKRENFENDSQGVRLQAELKRLSDSLAQCQSRLNSNDDVHATLMQKVSEAEAERTQVGLALVELNAQLETLQAKQSEANQAKDALTLGRTQLLETATQLRVSQAERTKDVQSNRTLLDDVRKRLSTLEREYLHLDEELANQSQTIEEREQSILESQRLEEELTEKSKTLRGEISQWQRVHRQHEERVNKVRLKLRTLNDDKENLSKELIRLDERKNTYQRDYDDVISQLFDVYEMTFTEAEAFATPVEDIQSAQRELADLKNQIKALGHVNVSAIDEFREVSERYKFMSEQLIDTQKAKSELERLIADLTKDMQNIFTENFYKINENFKSIFVELFGGGSAELILTDTQDVLNSGIEIVVAPPGKVIKSLISLSGGEQAFVAIAIYFAILKVKPSPFCILDEIDAPLDEVNVRKYAVYLNHFVDNTQFIVVTHRRGTMESADVLYGVTMQKDGVSKLLKMEQKDIPNENF